MCAPPGPGDAAIQGIGADIFVRTGCGEADCCLGADAGLCLIAYCVTCSVCFMILLHLC